MFRSFRMTTMPRSFRSKPTRTSRAPATCGRHGGPATRPGVRFPGTPRIRPAVLRGITSSFRYLRRSITSLLMWPLSLMGSHSLRALSGVSCLPVVQQRPPYKIQRLPHSEVEAPIHGALRFPTPELPGPRHATNPALAAFVHIMLPEQHDHTSKQPHCVFLEDRRRDRFVTSKFPSQLHKLF
jgi:hypothetical protein